MRFIQIVLLAVAALVCALIPARAEKRVALVIGNGSYANLPSNQQILKAANDARSVGGAQQDNPLTPDQERGLKRGDTFRKCADCVEMVVAPAGCHYQPNAFGLYDRAGNAYRWTEDCWHRTYAGAPVDGSAWTTTCYDSARMLRGGSWILSPRHLRAAYRFRLSVSADCTGFRLARMLNTS